MLFAPFGFDWNRYFFIELETFVKRVLVPRLARQAEPRTAGDIVEEFWRKSPNSLSPKFLEQALAWASETNRISSADDPVSRERVYAKSNYDYYEHYFEEWPIDWENREVIEHEVAPEVLRMVSLHNGPVAFRQILDESYPLEASSPDALKKALNEASSLGLLSRSSADALSGEFDYANPDFDWQAYYEKRFAQNVGFDAEARKQVTLGEGEALKRDYSFQKREKFIKTVVEWVCEQRVPVNSKIVEDVMCGNGNVYPHSEVVLAIDTAVDKGLLSRDWVRPDKAGSTEKSGYVAAPDFDWYKGWKRLVGEGETRNALLREQMLGAVVPWTSEQGIPVTLDMVNEAFYDNQDIDEATCIVFIALNRYLVPRECLAEYVYDRFRQARYDGSLRHDLGIAGLDLLIRQKVRQGNVVR